jgi:surface antigen
MKRSIIFGLLAVALAACQSEPTKEQVGTITGGVLGGALGSQVGSGHGRTAAIVAGTLAGAFIGGQVGKSMDETDRLKAAHALETAPTGAPTSWRNPDTGSTYTVTPTRTYQASSGPCREYTTQALIDGKQETLHGTACRQPDGTWKAV